MPEVELFDKTELWLVGVTLDGARLPELAATAASVLGLQPRDVFVTDVRDDHIVLDLVVPSVQLESIVGRESALLEAVALLHGVTVGPTASVHSRGVLGILGTPADQVDEIVSAARSMHDNLRAYVERRVAVVSTGPELGDGRVHDTNTETIRGLMVSAGYDVEFGGFAPDDERAIAGRVARLADDGYGIIITTGGVGAEEKDRTIEALQILMPDLATAVLATYTVGHGRHVKPHVRVGVGQANDVTIVALPGPTREVQAGVHALLDALQSELSAQQTADAIAESIKALWRHHPPRHHHHEPSA